MNTPNTLTARQALKARFAACPTSELMDNTAYFKARTEAGQATELTAEAWSVVLEILAERGA